VGVFSKIINILKGNKPNKKRFGYLPDFCDFRDFVFTCKLASLPESVDLRSQMPPIFDQGNLNSCVSNAISAISEFLWMKQIEGVLSSSRLFIYYNGRVLEDSTKFDDGIMIRDGIKGIIKNGICLDIVWPYDESKVFIKPPSVCYDTARVHKVLVYKRIPESLESMKTCLASGYPFIFGASLYDSFDAEEVTKTGIVPTPQIVESFVGGHCMTAVGYSDARRLFIVRNSWGELWGDRGHCFMPYDYLANPNLCENRWMITNVV